MADTGITVMTAGAEAYRARPSFADFAPDPNLGVLSQRASGQRRRRSWSRSGPVAHAPRTSRGICRRAAGACRDAPSAPEVLGALSELLPSTRAQRQAAGA